MDINAKTIFEFDFLNHTFEVTRSITVQWVIMAIIIAAALLVTRNLGKIPSKRQTVIEMLIGLFDGLVGSNMGPEYKKTFVPYIGTLGIFMFIMNSSGLFGVAPSTKDINVTLTFAMISFFVINGNQIVKHGLGGYVHSFFMPYALMLPMNLIEKVTIPLSLCLRLFINMLVGTILMELVYMGMGHFAFLVPVPLHFFFDLFVAAIQTFVFMMLTMVYTKTAAEH
ncbi:MAG TPA: F0F1 ATP synthase subunit A [Anaerovoracaceae bacterium]|nr:F0F1 ATP synthase subunit A [Anaerovoracaceae bacterium]